MRKVYKLYRMYVSAKRIAVLWAVMFAPLSASRATISEWPFKAAVIRGVDSSYKIHGDT